MISDNNATRLHREILIRLCAMHFAGELKTKVDRLPIELRPREMDASRCCVYRDRALIKYRCMAALGTAVEDEKDELTPLSEYVERAVGRRDRQVTVRRRVLSVLDEACAGCVRSRYYVTDACRGCLARPCTLACPKDAVQIVDGQARIDSDLCVNCGRCMKVCPYHAIVYIPIPCEEACPVGAITRGEGGKQAIDSDRCIDCGKCITACPFGAVLVVSELIDVLEALAGSVPTVALLAPSVAGQFDADLGQIIAAVKELGFDEVLEVAWGAEETARTEAAEFAQCQANGQELLATSCCPAWMAAVEKHLPNMKPYVSATATPMNLTAREARRRWPEALTVFVGPCVAKRREAMDDANVDLVLSFEELGAAFVAADIEVEKQRPADAAMAGGEVGRGFPRAGGVARAVGCGVPGEAEVKAMALDGLTRKGMAMLKAMPRTRKEANFLEVMVCEGGCVGGPVALRQAGSRATSYAAGRSVLKRAGQGGADSAGQSAASPFLSSTVKKITGQ